MEQFDDRFFNLKFYDLLDSTSSLIVPSVEVNEQTTPGLVVAKMLRTRGK